MPYARGCPALRLRDMIPGAAWISEKSPDLPPNALAKMATQLVQTG